MSLDAGELRVADLMTRAVHTLTATQSVPLAEALMSRHHIRHIPVVDDTHRLVGLVTHRDLLSAKISTLTPLSEDERSSLELVFPVSRIMRTQVWTIGPEAFAFSAAQIMREHRFGCLPVVDDGKLVGILSEADLLALVTDSLALDRPATPWTMERVMTRVPVSITASATLAQARAAMSRYGIRHLPVMEDGKPVAIVCDRELSIAEAIFREIEGEHTSAAYVVRLLGSPRVLSVAPTARVESVVRDMLRERVEAVLVVDQGQLVGIFTAVDVCRVVASRLPPE